MGEGRKKAGKMGGWGGVWELLTVEPRIYGKGSLMESLMNGG